MSLSNVAEALPQTLIEPLNYKLSGGAAYVETKNHVSFFPSSGNEFSSTGVRVIRLPLTGDGWLVPESSYLTFALTNRNQTADTSSAHQRIEMIGGVHSVFGRVRVLLGGQECESLENYGRLVTQQLILSPPEFIRTYQSMGVGLKNPYPTADWQYFDLRWLGPGQTKHVAIPGHMLCGLLGQKNWLPLRLLGPMVLELEIIADPSVACRTGSTGNTLVTTFGSDFAISDVQFKADLCHLSSEMENSISETLLSGRALTLALASWSMTAHGIPSGTDDPLVSSQRAVSRLKSVIVSLFSSRGDTDSEINLFAHPNGKSPTSPVVTTTNYEVIDDAKDPEFQFRLNGEVMPILPSRHSCEHWIRILQSIGTNLNPMHSVYLSDAGFKTKQFLMGIDTELIASVPMTGKNLRVGPSQLSIQLKNLSQGGTVASSDQITKVFFASCFDILVEIRDTGITVLQ